jgi:hypothetical protein
MRCSSCYREIKPVVAVDIDGTLGDYHGHFIWFAVEYFNLPDDDYTYSGGIKFKEWWMDVYQMSEKDWHDVKLAYRQGGMKRTMPIYEGAADLCHLIRSAGAELWITTTRPYLSLDNIVPDTVEWCRRHGIRYDGMLFDEDKYEQLAHRIDSRRVVAIFDDLVEMCDAAAKTLHFGIDTTVLVLNNYNQDLSWMNMCTLETAPELAVERINWWRESYAA